MSSMQESNNITPSKEGKCGKLIGKCGFCDNNIKREDITHLDVSGCENITSIGSEFTSLQVINCCYCPNLETIAPQKSLLRFYAHDCPKLWQVDFRKSIDLFEVHCDNTSIKGYDWLPYPRECNCVEHQYPNRLPHGTCPKQVKYADMRKKMTANTKILKLRYFDENDEEIINKVEVGNVVYCSNNITNLLGFTYTARKGSERPVPF